MRIKIWVVCLIIFVLPLTVFAQAKVGTTAAQFLKIGVSARAAAMGEAFIAVSNDVSSIHYNPGGLVFASNPTVYGTHMGLPADISYDYVSYSQPLLGGVMGVSVAALTMDNMDRTDIFIGGSDGTTFGAGSYYGSLTYARSLTDRFVIGGTFKWIQEYLDDESSSEPAADVGVQYKTGFRSLRMGFAIKNFGPDSKFIEETHPLPTTFFVGFAYDAFTSYPHVLTLAFDGSHPSDNSERYNVGGEYGFRDMFFLRSGYMFEYDAHTFAFGGGAKVPLGPITSILDYAYQDLSYLENVHRISLTFQF